MDKAKLDALLKRMPSTIWLPKPFFDWMPAREDYVTTTSSSGAPAFTLTVEAFLQATMRNIMSNIGGWLNPNYNTFLPARTAQAIVDMFTATAIDRTVNYPSLGAGVNSEELGAKWGGAFVSLMQQIDSGQFTEANQVKYAKAGVSLFDQWLTITEPPK